MSSGAGVENVDAALQLLTDSKPARVLMAQVRQPLSDRNGLEGQAYGGRKHVDEMNVAELHKEVSENRNTIYLLQKTKQKAATEQLARRKAWAGSSAGRAAGTQDRRPSAGGGRQLGAKGAGGPPREPSLRRSRQPRSKPTCCGQAGDRLTQMRS